MKHLALFVFCALLASSVGASAKTTEHRGIDMPVNRTGYHMMVVIEDPDNHGKYVSIIHDELDEECTIDTIALHRAVPDAWVCCYHTPEQAKACGR
jgi:hypothetical protein